MDCMIGTPRIERDSSSADPGGAIKVATWRPSGWSERTDSGCCDGWSSLWSKATRRLTEEAPPLGAVVVRWRAEFCDQPERGTRQGRFVALFLLETLRLGPITESLPVSSIWRRPALGRWLCLLRSSSRPFSSVSCSQEGGRLPSKRLIRVLMRPRRMVTHSPRAFPWEQHLPWAPARVRESTTVRPERADRACGAACAKDAAQVPAAALSQPALLPGTGMPAAGPPLAGGPAAGQTSPGCRRQSPACPGREGAPSASEARVSDR